MMTYHFPIIIEEYEEGDLRWRAGIVILNEVKNLNYNSNRCSVSIKHSRVSPNVMLNEVKHLCL